MVFAVPMFRPEPLAKSASERAVSAASCVARPQQHSPLKTTSEEVEEEIDRANNYRLAKKSRKRKRTSTYEFLSLKYCTWLTAVTN
jgi:hypothetical protein